LITVSDYASAVKVLRVLLSIIGGHLSKDVNLVYKVIRIGKAHLESAKYDSKVENSWLNIISQNIFPAVSLTYSNPGLTCELWSFLKIFPYTTRYGLYGEWKNILYKKIPEMSTALIGCEKDTKYIMA
jgi:THO complex subunit 2